MAERLSPPHHLKLGDECGAIEDERLADLIAAELVHELDGAAAAHPEHFFHDRPIDDRYFEPLEILQNLRKSQKPFGNRRQV